MFWREDVSHIWVLYHNGTWQEFVDQWVEGSPVPSRGSPPPGKVAPVRGFGYIWGTYNHVAEGLGWALEEEKGFCARVQEFEQGFLFASVTVPYCRDELYNWATHPDFHPLLLAIYAHGMWEGW